MLHVLLALSASAAPTNATDEVGLYARPNSYTVLRKSPTERLGFHFGYSQPYDRGTPTIPFTHDEDGDGDDSIGYYNSREGRFYFANANPDMGIDLEVTFVPTPFPGETLGMLLPVVLDVGGDGNVDVGVFDTANNRFYLQGLPSFTMSGPEPSYPVVGDWDGDGENTVGLYSPSISRFNLNNSVPPSGLYQIVSFGSPGSLPCTGDWDADGVDEVGYFDLASLVFSRKGAVDVDFSDEEFFANFNVVPSEPGHLPLIWALAGDWDHTGTEPAPYPWQTVDPEDLHLYGFGAEKLAAAVAAGRELEHLNSLIVVRDGLIMAEDYNNGYTERIANHMMSTTKSVLSALFGAANLDGAIPGDPATPRATMEGHLLSDKYSEPGHPLYPVCGGSTIDLVDVMTMSSGFEQDNTTWDDGTPPDMFPYGDYIEWILDGPPGESCASWWDPSDLGTFKYYGGNNHVAAEALRRYVADHPGYPGYTDLFEFAKDQLFDPLGILPTRWDHEPSSNTLPATLGEKVFFGPSQMFMRPRDMARFGQLFLEGGTLDGNQILHPEWVAESTADYFAGGGSTHYGYWWWRELLNKTPLVFGEHAGYHALGYGGQHIYVFPTLDLLVVMTSNWVGVDSSAQQITDNEDILLQVLQALL